MYLQRIEPDLPAPALAEVREEIYGKETHGAE